MLKYALAGNREGWSLEGLTRKDEGDYAFFYRGDKCVRVIRKDLLGVSTASPTEI